MYRSIFQPSRPNDSLDSLLIASLEEPFHSKVFKHLRVCNATLVYYIYVIINIDDDAERFTGWIPFCISDVVASVDRDDSVPLLLLQPFSHIVKFIIGTYAYVYTHSCTGTKSSLWHDIPATMVHLLHAQWHLLALYLTTITFFIWLHASMRESKFLWYIDFVPFWDIY